MATSAMLSTWSCANVEKLSGNAPLARKEAGDPDQCDRKHMHGTGMLCQKALVATPGTHSCRAAMDRVCS